MGKTLVVAIALLTGGVAHAQAAYPLPTPEGPPLCPPSSISWTVTEYAGGHALWMPGLNGGRHKVELRFADDAVFTVHADGHARLTGTAYVSDLAGGPGALDEEWDVDLAFDYRGRGDEHGGPKIERPHLQPPEVTDAWDYFDMYRGTLSRPGSTVTLVQRPLDGRYPFQMGEAANGKNAAFGASMWFLFTRVDDDGRLLKGHGDINVELRPLPVEPHCGSLTGRLTCADGAVITGARVLYRGPDCDGDGDGDVGEARTDRNGGWWLPELCPGDYTLSVPDEDVAPVQVTLDPFEAGKVDLEAVCGKPPVCRARSVKAPLDETCAWRVGPEDVDAGSADPDGGPVALSLSPDRGEGKRSVQVELIVTDDEGEAGVCEAWVDPMDVTPPRVKCGTTAPAYECRRGCGDDVGLRAVAHDACDGEVEVSHGDEHVMHPGGELGRVGACYPLGVTPVRFTARDAAGNVAACDTRVRVVDTRPPDLLCGLGDLAPWAAQRIFVVRLAARDACDAAVPTAAHLDCGGRRLPVTAGTVVAYMYGEGPCRVQEMAGGGLKLFGPPPVLKVDAADRAGNLAHCRATPPPAMRH